MQSGRRVRTEDMRARLCFAVEGCLGEKIWERDMRPRIFKEHIRTQDLLGKADISALKPFKER